MAQHPHSRLAQSDTWLLELFLALYTLVWGLAILNPWLHTFEVAPRAYSVLAQFPGGELVFGAVLTAIGVATIISTTGCSLRWRSTCSGIGFFIWMGIGLAIAIPTDWAASGLSHFFLAAVGNWFCWSRLRYRGAG